jgi:hypothetical protein
MVTPLSSRTPVGDLLDRHPADVPGPRCSNQITQAFGSLGAEVLPCGSGSGAKRVTGTPRSAKKRRPHSRSRPSLGQGPQQRRTLPAGNRWGRRRRAARQDQCVERMAPIADVKGGSAEIRPGDRRAAIDLHLAVVEPLGGM